MTQNIRDLWGISSVCYRYIPFGKRAFEKGVKRSHGAWLFASRASLFHHFSRWSKEANCDVVNVGRTIRRRALYTVTIHINSSCYFTSFFKRKKTTKLNYSSHTLLFSIWLRLKPIAPEENTAFAKWVSQTPPDCSSYGWCRRRDGDKTISPLKSWRVSVVVIRLPAAFNDYYNNNEDILWTSLFTAHLLHEN